MIYFDQAASSFPKPASVAEAMAEAVNSYGANPGRGGHKLSRHASSVIENTRTKLQGMFHVPSKDRIIFTSNATAALNQAIMGLSWEKGDHVITTELEHNSVRRPLEKLKNERYIKVDYVNANEKNKTWLEEISNKMTSRTKLVVMTHGSNVTGQILPIQEIGELLSGYKALFCVDAAQTAGVIPINMKEMKVDLMALAGHKSLMGPQGIGCLFVQPDIDLKPVNVGGTGSQSENPEQPVSWPTGWESGTMNTPGIAGLLKGLEEVERREIEVIHDHERRLAEKIIQGLLETENITVFGPVEGEDRLGVVAFKMDGVNSHEVAMILDEHYDIAVRAGLHCSPLIHETFQTMESGLVRASVGIYNTEEEVSIFLQAVKEIKEGLLG